MLQSHSTPSVSDTIYIIRNDTETKSVSKHSCGAHSPQTKRDQCGMGSHTLNQEFQCGMIYGVSESVVSML